jgi:predicted ATPase
VHITRGEAIPGTRLLRTALEELRGARFAARYTQFLGALAEGLGVAGQIAEGLAAIDEALERSERNDERWCEAELLRIKGELLVLDAAPGGETAAENHFSRAVASARRQGALSWELRSCMSLARLWHRQGRTGSAHELLAPVYARFTEAFDTADLKAAKALLSRFAQAGGAPLAKSTTTERGAAR